MNFSKLNDEDFGDPSHVSSQILSDIVTKLSIENSGLESFLKDSYIPKALCYLTCNWDFLVSSIVTDVNEYIVQSDFGKKNSLMRVETFFESLAQQMGVDPVTEVMQSCVDLFAELGLSFDQHNGIDLCAPQPELAEQNRKAASKIYRFSDDLELDRVLHGVLVIRQKHFNEAFNMLLEQNRWGIDDKVILVNTIINEYSRALEDDKLIQPFDNVSVFGKSIILSKQTCDGYVVQILKFLNELLIIWGEDPIKIDYSKYSFDGATDLHGLFDVKLSEVQIRYVFRAFVDKGILHFEEVEDLIKSNFTTSSKENVKPRQLLFSKRETKDKGEIAKIVASLYQKDKSHNSKPSKKEEYAIFLRLNFKEFSQDKLDTITRLLRRNM